MNNKSLIRFINGDRILGLLFIILGAIGIFDTVFGTWRAGPGFGAKLFPQLIFIALLLCGVLLLFLKTDAQEGYFFISLAELKSLVLVVGSGFIYFIILRRVGLVVTTAAYFIILFALFTPEPMKHWKRILIPCAIATLLVWILFTQLVSILMPSNVLLF